MNKDSFLYVVVFTFLAAFIFVFIIAFVDGATADRVARNREIVTAQAYLNALGLEEEDGASALAAFNTLFGTVEDEIAQARVDGENVWVKRFQGNGLWGLVTGVIAVDESLSRIVGLDIISHTETPGLGGRIEEAWFKNQFRNERIGADGLRVRKGEGGVDGDSENSSVDGITGASLTSAAMEVIINDEINALRKEVGR